MQNIKSVLFTFILAVGAATGGWTIAGEQTAYKKECPKAATMYIGSVNNTVHHVPNCRAAARIKPTDIIAFASQGEAANAGYRSCLICRP